MLANRGRHLGVGAQTRHIIHDGGSGLEGGTGDRGLGRVDGDRRGDAIGQGLDYGEDAAEFFGRGHRFRAGPRAFAADVQDVRSLFDQPQSMVDRGLRVEESAAVGETVGRDVDDAHQ